MSAYRTVPQQMILRLSACLRDSAAPRFSAMWRVRVTPRVCTSLLFQLTSTPETRASRACPPHLLAKLYRFSSHFARYSEPFGEPRPFCSIFRATLPKPMRIQLGSAVSAFGHHQYVSRRARRVTRNPVGKNCTGSINP